MPPLFAIAIHMLLNFRGNALALFHDVALDGLRRAFADFAIVHIHAGHAGLRGEGNEDGIVRSKFAASQAVFFFGQDDDRAAFGRFVGKGCELRGVRKFGFGDARSRVKSGGFAIAERDGAGFIEQQHVDVTGGFHSAAGHGNHVALNQAIHARNADRGEQPADGRGNQADQQRDQHENALRRAGINGEGLQSDDGQQKDNR